MLQKNGKIIFMYVIISRAISVMRNKSAFNVLQKFSRRKRHLEIDAGVRTRFLCAYTRWRHETQKQSATEFSLPLFRNCVVFNIRTLLLRAHKQQMVKNQERRENERPVYLISFILVGAGLYWLNTFRRLILTVRINYRPFCAHCKYLFASSRLQILH